MGFAERLVALLERHFDERYGRDPSAVYVHEVLQPLSRFRVGDVVGRQRALSTYLVVGEAVELGLRAMLGAREPPRAARRVVVSERYADAVRILAERGVEVRRVGEGYEFVVSGQTDVVVEDDPVRLWELKTTRSDAVKAYKLRWEVQAALYAWLYDEPVRLVVININKPRLIPYSIVFHPSDDVAKCVLTRWLRGDDAPWRECTSASVLV